MLTFFATGLDLNAFAEGFFFTSVFVSAETKTEVKKKPSAKAFKSKPVAKKVSKK